ncbi:MAG: tellurite resistance protein TerC [Solirubrobacteraceae bacterium]|jgi:tellurite resistance protein TerC|nr:tellurite resistance protein TerC [Solirubrobacteraceae bacterium]MEA2318667.1 tellurite resistance protein TerC [Solirubrobacteraceae bacterium]
MLPWLALGAFVLIALAIDLRADNHTAPSMRSALLWSVLWTGIGVAFAGVLLLTGAGSTAAEEYLAGFLIEKSLSLDNLFVFAVLFSFFAVPAAERHRVLLLGVAGAIVLRTIFIVAGAAALDAFHFMTYILGALLAVTAIKIARHDSKDIDPEKNVAMRLLRRVMPVSDEYDGSKLTTTVGGRRAATPLAAALVMVAAFDVMFAIDSIPAIFAITRDTFIVFAANAFSLLGMISLYFLLDGMLERFRHLHLGLAAILGWVAAKLILVDVWHPPITLTLAVVAGSLAVAAVTSMIADRRERRAEQPAGRPDTPAAAEAD